MGDLSTVVAPVLAIAAVEGALQQADIAPAETDEMIFGCVLTAGIRMAPARQIALKANLGEDTPAMTVNKVCASGMQATLLAADAVRMGRADIVVAGGMENMSRAPYLLQKARAGYRYGHDMLIDHMLSEGLTDAYDGKSMGEMAQITADRQGLTRSELDQFAKESLTRAKSAVSRGTFAEEITPVRILDKKNETFVSQDELPPKLNPEQIPRLSPAFGLNGTLTAASSSGIADGAAALVLASEKEVARRNLKPLARITASASHACKPSEFTTAPIPAIQAILERPGWSAPDKTLFEINEAFASVPLVAKKELGLSSENINPNGGACALGHPIGCSGARILVTLIYEMCRRDLECGVGAVCVGGGEGLAIGVHSA